MLSGEQTSPVWSRSLITTAFITKRKLPPATFVSTDPVPDNVVTSPVVMVGGSKSLTWPCELAEPQSDHVTLSTAPSATAAKARAAAKRAMFSTPGDGSLKLGDV